MNLDGFGSKDFQFWMILDESESLSFSFGRSWMGLRFLVFNLVDPGRVWES